MTGDAFAALVVVGLLFLVFVVVSLATGSGGGPEPFTVFTEYGPIECVEAEGGGAWCSRVDAA